VSVRLPGEKVLECLIDSMGYCESVEVSRECVRDLECHRNRMVN
jgi:hypothetical protein